MSITNAVPSIGTFVYCTLRFFSNILYTRVGYTLPYLPSLLTTTFPSLLTATLPSLLTATFPISTLAPLPLASLPLASLPLSSLPLSSLNLFSISLFYHLFFSPTLSFVLLLLYLLIPHSSSFRCTFCGKYYCKLMTDILNCCHRRG